MMQKWDGLARMTWQRLFYVLTSLFLASLVALGSGTVTAKDSPASTDKAVVTMTAAQLPPQGQNVLTLIYQGGPFKHDKDGTVFGNRERILPLKPRGYYREYTVRTPGVESRGARRIVCGGQVPVQPDACFYTEDHYASFRQIVR